MKTEIFVLKNDKKKKKKNNVIHSQIVKIIDFDRYNVNKINKNIAVE